MGMFTEYFAASPEQAVACAEDGPSDTALPQALLKGVDQTILLGALWAAAAGTDAQPDPSGGALVAGDEEEGPWTFAVQDECTAALAEIADDRLAPVAAQWSRAEEWYGGHSADELVDTVRELRTVARAAREPGRRLYVWVAF